MRVAKREHAVAGDLRHAGVGAAHPRVHPLTAAKIVSGSSETPCAAACSELASTFSSTSESESVLMWRRSRRYISSLSCSQFVRLPLCASMIPNGAFT